MLRLMFMNVCIVTKCSHVVSLCSYCTGYVCHQTHLVGMPACTSSFSVLHSPCKQLCGRKNIKFQDKSWHPDSSFLRTAGYPCYICTCKRTSLIQFKPWIFNLVQTSCKLIWAWKYKKRHFGMGKYETAAICCLCVQTSIKHVRNSNEERLNCQHGIQISELDGGRLSVGDMSGKITVCEVFQNNTMKC